jgi:hypothetical protein
MLYFLVGANSIGGPQYHGPYSYDEIWDEGARLLGLGAMLNHVQGRSGELPVTLAVIRLYFRRIQDRSPPDRP